MDFFGGFGSIGKKAVKFYDYTKLEMKIKAYEKEANRWYSECGKTLYDAWVNSKEADEKKLTEYMENVKNINFRIAQLNKNITEIRKQTQTQSGTQNIKNAAETADLPTYTKLSKSDNDLKISRTSDGIKMLRFCPECSTGNNAQADICEHCGHTFTKR